jgi:radical SAM superfamily enzyme YgiQ (UPF0313 family)
MLIYIKKYNITNFDFYDMTMAIDKKWLLEFTSMLIDRKLNVTWQLPSGSRSEAIDYEIASMFYKSGCRNISYAPESGSKQILDMIQKKINLNKMLKSMRSSVKAGLIIKANIICGFPMENYRHLIETFVFIIRMAISGVHEISINQFSPYPGSMLFNMMINNKQIKLDDEYFDSLRCYSSMTRSQSFSNNFGPTAILIFKNIGMLIFYVLTFLIRPLRLFKLINNIRKGIETTRLEKIISFYLKNVKFFQKK